jgi:methylated-DNA-[protein]-cysteine S-methyltransferase
MYTGYFESGFGMVEVTADETAVTSVRFVDKMDIEKAIAGGNDVTTEAVEQLMEYFSGKRRSFDMNIKLDGTDFQKQVWRELLKIPYGKTANYSEIAQQLGNEKGVRAVSSAIGKNPIAIVVPCHRVISKDGSVGSYAWGSEKKQFLLKIEKNL